VRRYAVRNGFTNRVRERRIIAVTCWLALVILAPAACMGCSHQAPLHLTGAPQDEAQKKKVVLDQLLAAYLKYGLPLPPKDAPLVRYETGETTDEKDERKPLISLGFLTKAAGPQTQAEFLIGTRRIPAWGNARPKEVKAEPGVETGTEISAGGLFKTNAWLATALQCHSRGWTGFAIVLLERSLKEQFDHDIPREGDDQRGSSLTEVAFLAWAHHVTELFRPKSDRSAILEHLKILIATESRLDVDLNRRLIADLEATLRTRKAEPGTLEALIDDLLELPPGDFNMNPSAEVLAIIERGFQAVPALMDHLEDRRLTRFVATGVGSHIPTYPNSVGDISAMLIWALAGWEEGRDDDGEWKRHVREWFEKAKGIGEEAYLLANARPAGKWPNLYALRILAKKYPRKLAELYRDLLEKRVELVSWPLTDQIVRSGLTREEKLDLLKTGARDANLDHRYYALRSLQEFDPDACVSPLVETLDALPATSKGRYWACREASFGSLVSETKDTRAWKALGAAARRADVGLRLELMSEISLSVTDAANRKEHVAFLSGFLADKTFRVVASDPVKFDSAFAARRFPRLEVRNAAAMMLVPLLGMEEEPNPEWTQEQWGSLRGRVEKTLRGE
jgi:hypothetical protein